MKLKKGLLLGIAVLLLVDVLWVGSAGLSRYLYTQASYEKPFFTTYFKTFLFSIYLSGFLFWPPWQRLCGCGFKNRKQEVGAVETCGSESLKCHETDNEKQKLLSDGEEEEGLDDDRNCDGVSEGTGDGEEGECGVQDDGVREVRGGEDDLVRIIDGDGLGIQVNECKRTSDVKSSTGCTFISSCTISQPPQHQQCPGRKEPPLRFSVSLEQCPLPQESKLEVCLIGPPEFHPLRCYDADDSDARRDNKAPLSPCENKCCRVRFKPTIEVREVKGKECSASLRKYDKDKDSERHTKSLQVQLLPLRKLLLLSLLFGIMWFFANYLYGLALVRTSVAVVNTLSATSGVFVMCLAGIPILNVTSGDKITLSRCLVTFVSAMGAVLVSLSPSGVNDGGHKFNAGALLALGGAMLYALYLVLLRKMVKEPDSLEIPMFFGFVGLLDTFLLLPFLLTWHYTKIETFELPPSPNTWTLLLVNGFVGTVLSELLWLWGVFLTSPLLGTLSLSLVTPLSIGYSIAIGKASFSWLFILGAVFVILAFVGVAILEHYGSWDPMWAGIKFLFTRTRNSLMTFSDSESRQILRDHYSPEITSQASLS